MGKKEFRAARRFSEFDTLFDKIKKVYDKKFSSLSAKQHIFVNMNQGIFLNIFLNIFYLFFLFSLSFSFLLTKISRSVFFIFFLF